MKTSDPIKSFTLDQARAMGFLPDSPIPPAQAWWNRFRFAFLSWITGGRIELQFKKPTPLAVPDWPKGEDATGPMPHINPQGERRACALATLPEPGPEADIAPLLAVNAKFQPKVKVKRTRSKSGHVQPTKRGGSPRSRFRK